MCQVYNQVGSLTTIKSHLNRHKINEYKSLNELILFQKNYLVARQQILSDHKLLIEQEKSALSVEIVQLDCSMKTKRYEVEQLLLLELENLKNILDSLPSGPSNIIKKLINYIKKVVLKLRILYNKLFFNFKIENSVKQLTNNYNNKNNRYQYISSYFEDAVMKSSLPQLHKLDNEKGIIDQINTSIYGALGEQKVVRELEKLSDDYILINDFTCRFHPPIYNLQENDYIKSIQIDHILLSPAGIFLIETKNWSQYSLNDLKLHSPVQQIKRANFALYKILNREISNVKLSLKQHHWGARKIPIKNLIVLINHKPVEEFQYVKVLTLNNLLSYVNYFKPCFSQKETQTVANYLLNFIKK